MFFDSILQQLASGRTILYVLFSLSISYLLYSLSIALYNITLHPLANIPGPKLRGAFHFPRYIEIWKGDPHLNAMELHKRYGNTVRIAPTAISFNNPDAWQNIYGQTQGRKQLRKDPEFYIQRAPDEPQDILSSNDKNHARIRRTLNYAFSEAALREQEPLMNAFFDLLILKLHEKVDGPSKGKVNIVQWLNFTTFDIIGDLCFGESFEALRTEEYHNWILNLFKGVKFASMFRIINAYPIVGMPSMFLLGWLPGVQKASQTHQAHTREKMIRRLETETTRKDFISNILRYNDEKGMSREEIIMLAGQLIVAGSETTATALSGAIFQLLQHPAEMKKLTEEIRTSTSPEDMSFAKLANLTYLNACLTESLRLYPPVAEGLPRTTTGYGNLTINGHFIAENTSVSVHQLAANHSPTNFASPEDFIPDRWFDSPPTAFKSDKRTAMNPFSVGPRNCVGQHLAWAEMRAILARLLWHFDIELCDESRGWLRGQKVFVLWDKPNLMIRLSRKGELK